jgi:hypothetical protein
MINNLYGVPAIDVSLGDQMMVANLAYGEYSLVQDPTEGKGSKIAVHGDPNAVIFAYADAVGSPANYFAIFVFAGTFPGTFQEDYAAYYAGQFVGKLSLIDGGAITVGDVLPVDITAMGQRMDFTLKLNQDANLDILESAKDITTGADAHLRIYNATGDVIFENEELTIADDSQGVYDAGWKGLALKAGTYTLEAGTFIDTSTGAFTLSVHPAQ